ncbi:MAG TPA: tRNA preQ1(34) S-adenosylmethionine ribosyltransferase-isomerase QueA [Vicinamibacterales bacterium]|nr:tRNA preQ1(34) S-adenosylmethionine ribosyltransferase-isomerase QueA [Vicinamibacterales bacterium]
MRLADFAFDLPRELIAQEPTAERGQSRLLILNRASGSLSDRRFSDLPGLLRRGDLLVVNDTRVFAARLLGRRLPGGGAAQLLLVRRVEPLSPRAEIWEALVHPGQRLKEGSRLELGPAGHPIHAEILDRRFHGRRRVRIWTDAESVEEAVDHGGHVPLPPYIKRSDAPVDRERYQTVYARERGSIAAPTAGLHFTPRILAMLDEAGIERAGITLHVGYGTFQPIRVERVEDHEMEQEQYEVSDDTAAAINRALTEGRRVVAVGTTTTRALESVATAEGRVEASSGSTNLFIVPGHPFRVVSGLLTNFHLPQSSLLLLVSAFAGRERALAAYRHAVQNRYRFYSYGDAHLIL